MSLYFDNVSKSVKFTELVIDEETLAVPFTKKMIAMKGPFAFTEFYIECGHTVTTQSGDDDDNSELHVCDNKIGWTGIINGEKAVALCKDDFVYKLNSENENCFRKISKIRKWRGSLPFYDSIASITKRNRPTVIQLNDHGTFDLQASEIQKEKKCYTYDKADDYEVNYKSKNFFRNKFR